MNIYGVMNSPSPVLISQSFTASETRVEEGVEFVSIPTLYRYSISTFELVVNFLAKPFKVCHYYSILTTN